MGQGGTEDNGPGQTAGQDRPRHGEFGMGGPGCDLAFAAGRPVVIIVAAGDVDDAVAVGQGLQLMEAGVVMEDLVHLVGAVHFQGQGWRRSNRESGRLGKTRRPCAAWRFRRRKPRRSANSWNQGPARRTASSVCRRWAGAVGGRRCASLTSFFYCANHW